MIRVGLAIDDAAALAHLEASALNFMKFFGFETKTELVGVE